MPTHLVLVSHNQGRILTECITTKFHTQVCHNIKTDERKEKDRNETKLKENSNTLANHVPVHTTPTHAVPL